MRRAVAFMAGAAFVNVLPAGTWLPPVRRFLPHLESPMAQGQVAITFDDGPHPQGTPAILDRLDQLGWPATFFMLGSAVEKYPDLAREVVRRGHAVGVHGHEHRYLIARLPHQSWSDLARAKTVVAEATGVTPQWWRPPYGVLSTSALAMAIRLNLRPLLWSSWGKDWTADATAEGISETIARGRLHGGTILLHDSDALSTPGSWRRTAEALPLIATRLEIDGLQVAPLPAIERRSSSAP
jgi:peptidoglycan/xylan/chitin deacetylase (PgdA/CDA1 family)